MSYQKSDIIELVNLCDNVHKHTCEYGNIDEYDQIYKKFFRKFVGFHDKYQNEFMLENYAPHDILSWFFEHPTLSSSDISSMKVILEQIKNEQFEKEFVAEKPSEFWSLIHISIAMVSVKKFKDGHYADAVESAMKQINSRLKAIYKKHNGEEKDGVDLMRCIFSPKNPLLKFEDITTESGKNVQEGFMHMFEGAMQCIRNPKAHDNLYITKESAIKQLVFASMLMEKIDESLTFTKIRESLLL